MKKLLSCLTAGLLGVQGLTPGAFAEAHAAIAVGSCEAVPGEIFQLPVEIQENPGIAALSLSLVYDTARLELLGTQDGGILGESSYLAGGDLTAVPYTMNWDDLTDNTGTGNVVLLSFKAKDDASGTTEVSALVNTQSTFNAAMEEVPFMTESGCVTFTGTAENTPVIRAGAVQVSAGGEAAVPVYLENNPGIAALSLNIAYDSKLTLLGAEDGRILGTSSFTAGNDLSANPYTLNWDDLGKVNNTGSGTAAVIRFQVPEHAEGVLPVRVVLNQSSTFNMDMEEVAFRTAEGAVIVTPETAAAAPTGAAVIVDTVSANVGDTVKVPVRLQKNPGVAALSLSISYDTAKLKLLGAADGRILGDSAFLAGNDLKAVPYKLNWDDLGEVNNTGNGIVATLRFQVLEAGTHPVSVAVNQGSTFNADMESVRFETVSGVVNAAAVTTAKTTTTAKPVTTIKATTAKPVTTAKATTTKPVTTAKADQKVGTVSVDTVSANVGDTVKVPVRLQKNPGVAALSLSISYDTAKLKLLGAADGRILGDSTFLAGNDLTAVPYKLNWDDLGEVNNTGNGIVATLRFQVLEAGTHPVSVAVNQGSTFNADMESVRFETVSGAVNAAAVTTPKTTTTAKPVTTTKATTAKPVTTTKVTTAKPVTTTKATTAKPVTTAKATTAKPVTTAKAVTTTAKAITTTAKPATTAEVTTAKPVTTTKANPTGAAVIIDTVTANVGDTVRVPVRLQKNPGVAALSLNISYDTAKLKLISVTDGRILGSSAFLSGRDLSAVPYTLNWDDFASDNNTGNGIAATLEFVVLESAYIPVSVSVNQRSTFNVNMEDVSFETVDGAVDASGSAGAVITAKPVTTTAKPSTTTAKPVTTTAKPVTTTANLVTTTAKPVTTTATPVTTTAKPVTTTAKPSTTTAKPVTTTAKPVTTTAKPVTTTATPVTTTAKPVTTTAKPSTTTAKPVTTTAKPVTTTAKPVTTTAKPVTTTAKPVTTTSTPITTTAMPVTTTAAPVTTAEPVTTTVSPNAAAIAADSVEAKVGETVRVPVRIQNNPGITALSLDVSYDNTKLKLIGAEDGRLLGTASFLSGRDLTMIPYTLNWDDLASENNTGNGIVAALKFEVLAEGSISVDLKLNQRSTFNVDLQEVAFATVNGTVHAVPAEQPGTGFLRGDIDLNGEVSIEDVQFALKVYTERISGKTPQLTDEQLRNGDVNEDGILSVDDAQYILMYYVNNTVAGKNVTWEALIPTLKKA